MEIGGISVKKIVVLLTSVILSLSFTACSPSRIEDASPSANDSSSSVISGPEQNQDSGSSEPAASPSLGGDENNTELTAVLQEKIDKTAPSGIFLSNFNASSADQDGYYLYTSGFYILGRDRMEETYQYAARTIQNDEYEDYPYTPAGVMDSALQEYFAIPSEDLHKLIENYDPEIDGYWAPMGGGGITVATTVTDCEAEDGTAVLTCETRTGASSEHDSGTVSTVTIEYSEEYGWRFLSCTVS